MAEEKVLQDILETVTFLRDHGASKEDLAALEQRVDKRLNQMASKDDLAAFATKKDLDAFATKEDLDAFATKENLATMKRELIGHIDAFAVSVKKFDEELAATQSNYDFLWKQIQFLAQNAHVQLKER